MAPSIDPKLLPTSTHDLPTPDPESPLRPRKPYRFSTLCATVENPDMKDQYGSSSVPIYQTSTFKGVGNEYDYSRSGNPTRSHLEHHIAKISSAAHAFTVSSGMAALDVILRLLKPGDEIIAGDDLYGGTNRLSLTFEAIRDVKERASNAIIVVDNTMMSPYLQRPLEHGADIVYDSATKYLSGHHDLMAGAITCNSDELAKQIAFTINSVGNALTPIDAFLLLRGIKTLALRMDHPGREVHQRIAHGCGAVLSFETGDKALSERVVGGTRLWGISVSFGCVNSLISMPCVMSHASIDAATRAARGLPENLIRLCVGIEDPVDLLDDLERALIDAGAIIFDVHQNKYVRVSAQQSDAISRAVERLTLENSTGEREDREWFVSAPGKVILFGEHAVVHGVTAIAASVDLRCYGLTTPRHDGKLSVHFNDIDDFSHEWDIETLPWNAVTHTPAGDEHPELLDQNLIDAITNGPLTGLNEEQKSARAASLAFLYMYMVLSGVERPSFNFTARSTLPIGAGLGSSASFSTCAATALLLLNRRIILPEPPAPTSSLTGHVHTSHQGRRAVPPAVADEVNRWAFVAEKILHGNPSGVDNSVAVYGGALAYTRAGFERKSGMEPIQGSVPAHPPAIRSNLMRLPCSFRFRSLRFLLTNSKVPRDTKKLVAGVGKMKTEEPDVVNGILQAIQSISDEARRALADPEMARESLLTTLAALITENHTHLVALGVSHPALEAIRSRTAVAPYGLSSKLTGAGGGGCAVTLVPDDFQEHILQDLTKDLLKDQYEPYLTSVGGSGLGILSPYGHHRRPGTNPPRSAVDLGQVTPPGTPSPDRVQSSTAGDGMDLEPLRVPFETSRLDDLASWADGLGRWLYV
ncbi:cystathionine beta-lyase [Infundibulicybe gibba]|nr:cystathionine beta-lyase [Infundibulicybe gibba]